MTEEQWREYVRRSRTWAIRVGFEMLHSEAYEKLDYTPALKVLNWFHEKVRVKKISGRKGKIHYEPVDDGLFCFPYREAGYRGLTPQQFSKALKELHRLGFIDVLKPGSALKGDQTKFSLSDRWKAYGTPEFKQTEYPRSVRWVNFGFKRKS